MCQVKEDIGRLKEGPAKVRLVHEAKTLAEGIFCDYVACAGFEDMVHLQDLARVASLLHARDHPGHILLHDRLQAPNATN